MTIQRASPNPATALGFFCCIGANVCVWANPHCCGMSCVSLERFSDLFLERFVFWMFSVCVGKNNTIHKSCLKHNKNLLEVAPELLGEPLVPKMRPG